MYFLQQIEGAEARQTKAYQWLERRIQLVFFLKIILTESRSSVWNIVVNINCCSQEQTPRLAEAQKWDSGNLSGIEDEKSILNFNKSLTKMKTLNIF